MDNAEKKAVEAANYKVSLSLVGIDILSVKEVGKNPPNLVVKFSIPEKVVVDREHIKKNTGMDLGFSEITQPELIDSVKKYIVSIVNADINSNLSETEVLKHCKFLCKVREGDIWDEKKTLEKSKEIQETYN
jgi:hypothetical protein